MRIRRVMLACAIVSAVLAWPAAGFARPHPYNTGCSLLIAGDLVGAEEQFKAAIKLNANDTDALNNLAVVYIRQGEHENAMPLLEKVLRLNPYYRGADLNIGSSYIMRSLNADALGPTKRAATASKGTSATRVKAAAYHNLGLIAAAQGDWENALARFEKAEAAATNPETEMCIAVALVELGETDKGIAALDAALRSSPDEALSVRIATNLAHAHYLKGLDELGAGRLDEARTRFHQSQNATPNAYADLGLALTLAEQGKYSSADLALDELSSPDQPEDVRAAAVANLTTLKERAHKKNWWLRWLLVFFIPFAVIVNVYALREVLTTPEWRVRNRGRRLVFGALGAVLLVTMLVQEFMNPYRTWETISAVFAIALVLPAWVVAGIRK